MWSRFRVLITPACWNLNSRDDSVRNKVFAGGDEVLEGEALGHGTSALIAGALEKALLTVILQEHGKDRKKQQNSSNNKTRLN